MIEFRLTLFLEEIYSLINVKEKFIYKIKNKIYQFYLHLHQQLSC
jgi:hypothetical protein